jgi:hypothetical protein
LPVTGADVIGDGVSEDMLKGPLPRNVSAGLTQNDGKLPLEINLTGNKLPGDSDSLSRVQKRLLVFEKKDGKARVFGTHLLGMPSVVETDAKNGGGNYRCKKSE